MLKKSLISPAQPRRAKMRLFPGSVLASLRTSMEGGNAGGVFPFAKIHGIGERPHEVRRSLSGLHSLRPCLGEGASLGEEDASADSGRAGEVVARVGRVRRLAFLSILR